MPTVKGKWMFNIVPDCSLAIIQEINFTADTNDWNGDGEPDTFTGIEVHPAPVIAYMYSRSGGLSAFDGDNWHSMQSRTVDFGETEQAVSDEFYVWLTANAAQQAGVPEEADETYTVKFSTLKDIANAIRSKTGKSDAIPVPELASEIESIAGDGGTLWDGTYSITDCSLIYFAIDGTTYRAEANMTWEVWAASTYNTTGDADFIAADVNGNKLAPDVVIVAEASYSQWIEAETEANDYGLTVLINDYTEEPNEYGTTVIFK